MLKLFATGPWY